jgi:L-fuconate dehydratase
MSMIDYVQISADLGERVIEYVDHLHEHFEDPCEMSNGAYQAPRLPGFSVKMHESSLADFEYPNGAEWRSRADKKIA